MEELRRRKFQGVLNILSFNRHFYYIGLSVLAVIFVSRFFVQWPELLFWLIVAAFAYGFLMPLAVSAYVYDFSGFYTFKWLKNLIPVNRGAMLMVNINAGFDETSFIIKHSYPASDLKVFDFYDPGNHTEPAIKRARKVSLTYPNTESINSDSIPLEDNCADFVFLLSAAHEIRSQEEKVLFLKECCRICKPEGQLIVVEHLRDFANFIAFSVGFTHFFSRATWKNDFKRAGFSFLQETKFTAFMSIFQCSPDPTIKTGH
jgi:SAM-dependent methyltransferase